MSADAPDYLNNLNDLKALVERVQAKYKSLLGKQLKLDAGHQALSQEVLNELDAWLANPHLSDYMVALCLQVEPILNSVEARKRD